MSTMLELLDGLKEITKRCRPDMHEPDEQDLKCRVIGDHLDNAFGEQVSERALTEGYQEFVVCLERWAGNSVGTIRYRINLANLIALVRVADVEVVELMD